MGAAEGLQRFRDVGRAVPSDPVGELQVGRRVAEHDDLLGVLSELPHSEPGHHHERPGQSPPRHIHRWAVPAGPGLARSPLGLCGRLARSPLGLRGCLARSPLGLRGRLARSPLGLCGRLARATGHGAALVPGVPDTMRPGRGQFPQRHDDQRDRQRHGNNDHRDAREPAGQQERQAGDEPGHDQQRGQDRHRGEQHPRCPTPVGAATAGRAERETGGVAQGACAGPGRGESAAAPGIGVGSRVRKVSVPADRILLGRVSGILLGRVSGILLGRVSGILLGRVSGGGDLSGSVRGGWVLPVGVFAGRVREMNVLVSSVPGSGILGRSVLGGLGARRVRRLGDLGRIRRSGWISLPGRFGRIGRVSAVARVNAAARRAEYSAHGPTLEGRPRGRHVRPRRVPGLPDRRPASEGRWSGELRPWAVGRGWFARTTGEVAGRRSAPCRGLGTPCAGSSRCAVAQHPPNRARHRSVSTFGAHFAPIPFRDAINMRAQQRSWPGDILAPAGGGSLPGPPRDTRHRLLRA